MRCGVIDVGSNTIRLSIYEYDEKDMEVLMHKKIMAGILNHISEGLLQPEGIIKLCSILKTYRNILDNLGIAERYCFATASLRGVSNQLEVLERVKIETGFVIEMLDGEEEARLDFVGATMNIPASEGIIVDIGGGSTELILYENNKIIDMVSLPFGSLSMYIKHVKRLLPKDKEKEIMEAEVYSALDRLPKSFYDSNVDCSVLCGIGGAIRGANAIYRSQLQDQSTVKTEKTEKTEKIEKTERTMTGADISAMLLEFDKEKKEALLKILKVKPDRVHTVVPGMIILKCIMERFRCRIICISRFGVREGYVKEHIIARR